MTARPAPTITDASRAFWEGGAEGELRIARCGRCRIWHHPPPVVCPQCHSDEIRAEPVSGRAVLHSFTINRYRWTEELDPPYVVADVELVEQPGLRLLTALVDCDSPTIGIPLQVRFEPAGTAWAPVFTGES